MLGIGIHWRLALAGAFVAVFACVPDASALTAREISCRDAAGQLARTAAFRTFVARQGCIRRTIHGNADPSIDCLADPEELGGPGTGDLATDRRLARLAFMREDAGDTLVSKCDQAEATKDIDPSDIGLDDVCDPASDDWHDIGACLVDLGNRATVQILEVVNVDSPSQLPASHLDCIKEVHRQIRTAFGTLNNYRARCFRNDDKLVDGGGALDCGATVMPFGTVETTGDAKVDKRLLLPFVRLNDTLRRKCDLPIAELGYDQTVPSTYTGVRFVDRVTLDDVIHALNDRLQEAVHLIAFGDTGVEGVFPVTNTGGFCGDGTTDAGEQCDDGNNISCDGCDRDCTLPACGNGASCANDGEECDDGNNDNGDGCSALCQSELCLNGQVNPGYDEECDDGLESFTCDTDCTFAFCGDGTNNSVRGEVCDTGVGVPTNTATCDSDCTAPFCLDGFVNPFNVSFGSVTPAGEQCDDGAESATCDTNCTLASCGDGDLNPTRGEVCDDANNDDDDDCVSSDTVVGSNCQVAFCGDGFICSDVLSCTGSPGLEVCDDGTGTPGSAESTTCNSDCTPAACGDSKINPTAGEVCDNGAFNGPNAVCVDNGADLVCVPAECGDGELCTGPGCTTGPSGGIEACDDGDAINTDDCLNNCAIAICGDSVVCSDPASCATGPGAGPEQCDGGGETADCDSDCSIATCGDSETNVTAGEACDDGGDSEDCDSNCTIAVCGDGTLNPLNTDMGATATGELCDDGNVDNDDPCLGNCTVADCGDGFICSDASCNTAGLGPEECDDAGESAACDSNCTVAGCGDATVNNSAGEECDAGGGIGTANETSTCDTDCTSAFCGDGTVNATSGETCDDGNDSNADPCPDDVTAGGTCTPATCGDGLVCNSGCSTGPGGGNEECDDAGESLACDTDCSLASCGDGDVNATRGEVCDDGNVSDADNCPSGGGGQCLATATCGDGLVCTDGACNTAGLGPEDCDDSGESATCDSNCTTAVCGDGTVNATAGEGCDDGDTDDNDMCPSGGVGSCAAVATCGDDIVCSDASCTTGPGSGPEGCDDGVANGTGNGFCLSDCSVTQVCGDGTTNGTEECDDNNLADGDGCSSACEIERFVFQTSVAVTPGVDFSGLAGADSLCNSLAAASSNAGVVAAAAGSGFRAWLSDSTGSVVGRFSAAAQAATGDFILPDGTVVANDWADLTDGSLDAAISQDEDGNAPANGTSDCTTVFGEDGVWTNTLSSGAVKDNSAAAGNNHCGNWASSAAGNDANLGDGGSTGAAWTDSCLASTPQCNRAENLYCIQQ